MPLVTVVLFSALRGLCEVLPISGSGHGAVARVWLETAPSGALDAILLAGPLLAIALAVRRRLGRAVGEGLRAVARPELFTTSPGARAAAVVAVACAVSLTTATVLGPFARAWEDVPAAVGVGFLGTALVLASTALTPRADCERRSPRGGPPHPRLASAEGPGLRGAVIVGLAHGLGVAPGASRIGAALTVLLWLGVRPGRALDLALLLSLPALALSAIERASSQQTLGGVDAGACALGLVIAFLCASIAIAALRGMLERQRLKMFAAWLVPMALATLAYARALPPPS